MIKGEKKVPGVLATEIATYQDKKAELLEHNQGDWVVIHDTHVLGCYHTRKDAVNSGIKEYGNAAFLAREVQEQEPVRKVVSFRVAR